MKISKIIISIIGIAASVAFLYFCWELTFLTVILAIALFCVLSTFQGAMHEVGHYVGGRVSGYKLVFLKIGPVVLKANRKGRLSISVQRKMGGQCVMLPKEREVIRYRAYNVGGIVANIIVTLGASALLFVDSDLVTLIFIELAFAGVLKIVSNLIPQMHDSYPTDGYILKLLKKRPLVQRDYAKYLSLYASMFWDEEICIDDYRYDREETDAEEELLYYEGIQDLLSDLDN